MPAMAPLFVLDGAAPRRVKDHELHKAIFRRGGTELHYFDGGSPLGDLAVTPEGLARVIRVLQGAALRV